MTRENVTIQDLVNLFNLITGDNDTYEYWLEAFDNDEKIRIELIDYINRELKANNYDGENDYHAMYWFAKGFKLPAPQKPKRYVDSDDYFFHQLHKYKVQDKINDFKRKRIHERFNRDLHKKDSTFLKDLMNHQKELHEFHQSIRNLPDDDLDGIFTPLELYKMTIDSFNDWKENNAKQDQLVKDIMERLEITPTNWAIDFESLNTKGRKQLFPLLKAFFEEHIATLPIIGKYKLQFKVDGQWHSRQLKPETFNKLMENFTEEHFIFNIDEKPPEYFYEKGGEDLPEWSLFSEIKFSKFTKYDGNNDVGGSFFKYLTTDKVPKRVVEYLQRLQIFDSLVYKDKHNKEKQREELNDCCFIYALKQTGNYSEEMLNQMRLRINNRYLSQSSINQLCEEFKLHIRLTYLDESAKYKKKQTIC